VQRSKNIAQLYAKQRKHRRFVLRLPVRVAFSREGVLKKIATITRNVSVGGLLLESADPVPLRTSITLKMDLRSLSGRTISLAAEGRVVRVESSSPHATFAIAVECKRPISEMTDRFSVAC